LDKRCFPLVLYYFSQKHKPKHTSPENYIIHTEFYHFFLRKAKQLKCLINRATDNAISFCQSQSHFKADSQSVCLGFEPTLWTFDQILLPFQEFGSGICCPASVGRPLWRKAGSVIVWNGYTAHLTSVTGWALLKKPSVVHPLKNFPELYGKRLFITVFTRALH
jgi:hypothetical protein